MPTTTKPTRHLILVLGDQLDRESSVFEGFDPSCDAIWMAEVREESTHVPSHKVRTVNFLACMRHFRDEMRSLGRTVHYRELDDPINQHTLADELTATIAKVQPERLITVEAGEYRLREALREVARDQKLPLEERPDWHFVASHADFERHADGRKSLRLEYFYRELRKRTGILMDGSEPEGGAWNFDKENRGSFGKKGPGLLPTAKAFPPNATTRAVIEMVEGELPANPGSLKEFDWPVTPADAEQALHDFIEYRLPEFGDYQDAMWTDRPVLYHARLSSAMNLKLIRPLTILKAVEAAYKKRLVPLAAAEGFVRQILGWREYVRGIYWLSMPGYGDRNALDAEQPLPEFYWTGDTDYNCLKHAIGQTLQYGYAHHIQRLMVTGLFSLLLGVRPREIHEWYLAIYIDAIEWVEMPNVIGMSQYADGGVMASKPYAATGKYIDRMSNYCKGCDYNPNERVGDKACPFTTLYWDFLMRHAERLRQNQRMSLQVKNVERIPEAEQAAIRKQAGRIRLRLAESRG